MAFQMDDYVDVQTRIADFRDKYPDGRLRQKDLQFIDFAGKSWVVFTAEAYRTEDDQNPAQGTAWEPVPGSTNFTRDSELQNCETAAWGRAIVAALASDTKNGVASREEVRNRQASQAEAVEKARADLAAATSKEDTRQVWQHANQAGVLSEQLKKAIYDRNEQLAGENNE